MESSSLIFITMACLFVLAILSKILNFHHCHLKLPPGPKPWPIIGNLNLLGPLPHQSLHKLSQRYGQLMRLRFGSYPVIVASNAEMAKQILRTHDHVFASRPHTAAGKYITYNYSNITWAPYGPHWRLGRKIFLTELFSSKRLESYGYIRVEEMRAFVSRLYTSCGKAIVVKEHLSHTTLSIITRIVLGKKYFSESKHGNEIITLEELQEMFDELFLLNGVLNIGDWIPWIGFLDLQGYVKRMKAVSKKFDRFYQHVLNEHRARRTETKRYEPKDMVDLLLQLADDPSVEVKLTLDGVKGFTQDLIAGGTDTSANVVEWAMSELLKHPYLIGKATEELDRVIGRQRWVEERDTPNLPYIDAIMKETMRLHPAVTLLVPHLALEECDVAGYDVPKGTRVFINTWSIGRDPALWKDPEQFNPERFIGSTIDVKGQNYELLPFGSGRRMCPGNSLGLKMIKSSLANMLHGFNWKLPNQMKPQDISMREVYGLVTVRKLPLVAVAEPRLPLHLYQSDTA